MAAPSYPEFHVTGAVHHYIRTPETGSTIYYLGTAEVTPKVKHQLFYKDVMNDIAGKSLPAQKTHDGEMAVVGVLLNRYSKAGYGSLSELGVAAGVKRRSGYEERLARGALVYGVETFELWQVFANAVDPRFRSVDMELGYYFPQVVLASHERDTLGTEVEKLMLVLEAYPKLAPYASPGSIGADGGTWYLYDFRDAAFPPDVLVPQ